MTSEEVLSLVKPPPFQCSKIDVFVRNARAISDNANFGSQSSEVGELQSCLNDVESDSHEIGEQFEELREAFEALRAWGQEWKDFALTHCVIRDKNGKILPMP